MGQPVAVADRPGGVEVDGGGGRGGEGGGRGVGREEGAWGGARRRHEGREVNGGACARSSTVACLTTATRAHGGGRARARG